MVCSALLKKLKTLLVHSWSASVTLMACPTQQQQWEYAFFYQCPKHELAAVDVNLAQIAFHQCSGNQCVAFSDIWDSCVGGNGFHPWAMTFMRQKYGRTRYVYVDHEPLGLSWPFCICLVLWLFF